ncbi:polyphosphate kinase 2 family protein [Dysgonomonas sp. GY75]|uniref:polyphosphate kinase 2 family protein n=1 Tax=Dysgonomonas sp. GY75 TaxID=2780419 RepID=UPI001883CBAC|nr:polyphosphate kinase 2 family protein [Dysgonomonas sp. GY75]MBF0649793.1 polyphosphate kinase 2 family protein [Dysgonomonas sp. GY75]
MKKDVLKKIIAKPGEKHKVSDYQTGYTAGLNKDEAERLLTENTEKLAKLQDKLYAQDRYSVLVIFQAMDAAGKDGTVKHVMSGINPQGCQVYSFKQPSAEELDHDYLWRIYKCLPERGRIGIFNRSHYEDVLVAKVHPSIVLNGKLPKINKIEDIDDKFWKKRYRQINDLERHLTENGTIILKFFLNVSHEEQEKRFLARLDDESKNWKFSASDLKEREHWDDYMKAYSDMLTHTSTEDAPWYVIPADNKWFMRYAVGEIICDRINDLKLHYPVLTETAKQELEAAKRILAPQNTDVEKSKTSPRTPKAAKIKTIKDKQAAKSDRKIRKS